MQELRVTLVQTTLCWEQPAQNLARFSHLLAAVTDTDLVVLPEMFSTGFTMASEQLAEPMDGTTLTWMHDMAIKLDAVICGSVIISDQGNYFNRFIWMPVDGNVQFYDKRHLFRMSDEHDHYSQGASRLILELRGFRICPQVCYDLRFPVWSRNDAQFDLLLYVANWPAARRDHWNSLLQARAIENLCYVVAVNRIGVDGHDQPYAGDSAVFDYNGVELLQLADKDCVTQITLNKHSLLEYQQNFPAYLDADGFDLNTD